MKTEYKSDIFKQVLIYLSIFYFTFGLFTTYTWGCKELDKLSNIENILQFWKPISILYGLLNSLHFIAILYCLKIHQKYSGKFLLINEESKCIFHILSIPLLFIMIFFSSWKFINECNLNNTLSKLSIFMTFGELLLVVGIIILINNLIYLIPNVKDQFYFNVRKFVLLISLIAVINYVIYHLVNITVVNFIKCASNSTLYKQTFPNFEKNQTNLQIAESFDQPLQIMLCICLMAYLIPLLLINENDVELRQNQEISYAYRTLIDIPENTEESNSINKDKIKIRKTLKLPLISFILSAIFITIILLMLLIVIALKSDYSNYNITKIGDSIITILPCPIYIISIILLCLQINAMNSWPKQINARNTIDKTFLWLGSAGILIAFLAEMESNIMKREHSVNIYIFYPLMISQGFFQFITLSLMFDREWKLPKCRSWLTYICPSFAMFSINLALFFIVLYFCRDQNSISSIGMENEKRTFIKLFNKGFHSLAVTLILIARLHSCLAFGKLTFAIY